MTKHWDWAERWIQKQSLCHLQIAVIECRSASDIGRIHRDQLPAVPSLVVIDSRLITDLLSGEWSAERHAGALFGPPGPDSPAVRVHFVGVLGLSSFRNDTLRNLGDLLRQNGPATTATTFFGVSQTASECLTPFATGGAEQRKRLGYKFSNISPEHFVEYFGLHFFSTICWESNNLSGLPPFRPFNWKWTNYLPHHQYFEYSGREDLVNQLGEIICGNEHEWRTVVNFNDAQLARYCFDAINLLRHSWFFHTFERPPILLDISADDDSPSGLLRGRGPALEYRYSTSK
jgi:hypothetical protein